MCVFLVMPLDPVALDSEQRDLGDGAVCSPDGSLHSGGGASSSGHSSDSDDLGDDCFSPPALADGGWLVESCL
ncbi:hypothetical protein DQ04_14071010 [Trypanosoma grayi]|uniref:hypothetical protein n=1 Tax=Trypanosoma grayi TaxID=71804 RepID=UPI0004F4AEC7|nr:hypothetical protein DQ04_14071010 [Trypanosoma grayi]KEG06409.1 hypothetical protein DQ04_14071010 [Trypanosoma grayi]